MGLRDDARNNIILKSQFLKLILRFMVAIGPYMLDPWVLKREFDIM